MTTHNPEQKDILEKLNEIALEANWGGKDRVYTAQAPNGMPKQIAVIMEAMEEIKRLRELPKEILQDLKDRSVWFIVGTAQFIQDHFWEQFEEMCETYGITLDENNS